MHILSYIVPAYNCDSTLEQAVHSIYRQQLQMPFEIIIVNDASSDATGKVIAKLQKQYKEIRVFIHTHNQGGGAARNTGIRHARGDLILCLDSDNYFADATVPNMVELLIHKQADGIVFHDRRFFYKNNTLIRKSHLNPVRETSFTLEDLFNDSGLLSDNFLFTKTAFELVGRYPEHHDFDTQGFEIRFLAKGLRLFTCEESTIFHRQGGKNSSYFERIYERGDFSKNMYLIYEEIMHLFNPSIQEKIWEYDIFKKNDMGGENLQSFLIDLYMRHPNSFFVRGAMRRLKDNTVEHYFEKVKNKNGTLDELWKAWYLFHKGKYRQSILKYTKLLTTSKVPPTIYFCLMRSVVAIHTKNIQKIEKNTFELLQSFETPHRKSIMRQHIAIIAMRKIKRAIL